MSIDTVPRDITGNQVFAREAFFLPPPEPSMQVDYCLDEYNQNNSHGENLIPREDIAKILKDYAGQYANEALYDAAHLIDLIDRLNNTKKGQDVRRALNEYMEMVFETEPDPTLRLQKMRYFDGIASDIEKINNCIEKTNQSWFTKAAPIEDTGVQAEESKSDHENSVVHGENTEQPAIDAGILYEDTEVQAKENEHPAIPKESVHQAIDYEGGPIPAEVWGAGSIEPNIVELEKLADEIHLETILVKSAQMLQLLNNPITPGAERMRTILAIESTYAPLCEYNKFYVLAEALLSATKRTRLDLSGNAKYITAAQEILDFNGHRLEVEEFMTTLPELLIGPSDNEAVIENTGDYGIYFTHGHSHAEVLTGTTDCYVDNKARIKTDGALAQKMYHYREVKGYKKGTMPPDPLGFKIIAKNRDQVPLFLADILERLSTVEGLRFVSSPSREQPIHIKARNDFILKNTEIAKKFQSAGKSICGLEVDPEPNNGGLEIVKITVQWPITYNSGEHDTLPIEFQITHEKSEIETLFGPNSHGLFKREKYGCKEKMSPDDVEKYSLSQKNIGLRKEKLKSKKHRFDMNERSREASLDLFIETTRTAMLGRAAHELALEQVSN